nr:hypothetical protein [Tanacetum cinerariifolium]
AVVGFLSESRTGILRTIVVGGKPFNTKHKLNKYKHIELVKQKKRGLAPERNEAACKEVDKLTNAGILQEVKYQTWVANPVVVESLSGFQLKCFLDAYKGYHQKQMTEGDEDNTSFFIENGVFCYRKVSFVVKNAEATYQRGGSISGHLITKQGIKANPSKIKVITNLKPPITLKKIQSRNGKLTALNIFLSKGAHRSLPFFKALKSCINKNTIQWTTNAEEAFQKIKEFIEILPMLTVLIKGEVLVMYLATLTESMCVVLLAEREKRQVLIYFVSKALQGAELNYPELEKLILAFVHAVRRLRSPEGKEYTYALRFEFKTINNEAEYEALLAGQRITIYMKFKDIAIFVDYQLVAN